MTLEFIQLRAFTEEFDDLGLRDGDLRSLESELLERPDVGMVVSGTGGLRKMRFAPPSWSRGKSGSTRVCYVWFPESAVVFFFTIYTKHDKDNISADDKNIYRKIVEKFRQRFKDEKGARS